LAPPTCLGCPVPTLISLHPTLGADHLVTRFLQNNASPASEYNQAGPEKFHGFNRSDLGAISHEQSVLLQIFLDALGFSQQVRRVFLGQLDKLLQRFHRQSKFLGEFLMLLVLPGVPQRGKTGLEQDQAVFQVGVEPLQFVGESPHLFGIHDCLRHYFPYSLDFFATRKIGGSQAKTYHNRHPPPIILNSNAHRNGVSPEYCVSFIRA
jgi:hypothetical protein